MMFQQEFGSIVSFCSTRYSEAAVILHEIPEKVPQKALYFPSPITSGAPFTSAAYAHSYELQARVFAADTAKAFDKSREIAQAIQGMRYAIPRLNEDGSESERKLIIADLSFRRLDERVASLYIRWQSRYAYEQIEYEKIGQVLLRQE